MVEYDDYRGLGNSVDRDRLLAQKRQVSYTIDMKGLGAVEQLPSPKFIGASWQDLPIPVGMEIHARGSKISVTTIGLQRLEGDGAGVTMHEESEYELVYPLIGNGIMTIQEGSIQREVPLQGYFAANQIPMAELSLRENGLLTVTAGDITRKDYPIVTPMGATHGTVLTEGPMIYLVVKGAPISG